MGMPTTTTTTLATTVALLVAASAFGAGEPSGAPTRVPTPLPSPLPSPFPTTIPTAPPPTGGKKGRSEYSSAQAVVGSVVTFIAFVVIGILFVVLFGNSLLACFCPKAEKAKAPRTNYTAYDDDARANVSLDAPDVDADGVELVERRGKKSSEDDAEFKAGYDEERPEGIANLERDAPPSLLCRRFPAPGEGGDDTFLLGCAAFACEADLKDTPPEAPGT